MIRFSSLRAAPGAPIDPVIMDYEEYGARSWFAVIPVRQPARVKLDEEQPVMVRDVPRVATSMRAIKLRPTVTVALLKRGAHAIMVLRGQDVEEVLALASLVDADAAIRLHELVRDIEGGNAAEVRLTTTAALGAAIFGGGR